MRSRVASLTALVIVAAAPLALGACATEANVGYAEVSSFPYDVSGYPYTYYDGRAVYWIGDRWYYRDGPSWVFYTAEPPPLYHYRSTYLYTPGPYYRYHAAPPAYQYPSYQGYPAYPTYAPPARPISPAPPPPARPISPAPPPPARPISPAPPPPARPISPPPAVRIR